MNLFEIRTGSLTPTFVMARDQRHALDLLAEHQPVAVEQTITIIPVANFIAGSTRYEPTKLDLASVTEQIQAGIEQARANGAVCGDAFDVRIAPEHG
jgi:hypothetical protein